MTTYRDPEKRPTVYDLLPKFGQFVGTVGRLDLDTSGLLLLTNDNPLAEQMTNPAHMPKTYLVKAATLLTDKQRGTCAGRGTERRSNTRRANCFTRPRFG